MSKQEKLLILGVNSDIGIEICKQYHRKGYSIIGTYRNDFERSHELTQLENVYLFQCDIANKEDIEKLRNYVIQKKHHWHLLFNSIGTTEPIGRFFDLNFDSWEQSIIVNFTGQLRAIHALYPLRDTSSVVDIALLAGGGTNGPFRCYSAYCVAKIALIKMCELLSDEADDINAFILGPGFVRTKTHLETLQAGIAAEGNFERVKSFIESGDQGTRFEDIYNCIEWCRSVGRSIVGGRNLSIVHDPWGTDYLATDLENDVHMFKLRRYRNIENKTSSQ